MGGRVVFRTFTKILWISLGIGVLAAPSLAATPVFMLQFGSFETKAEAEAQAQAISTKHGGILTKYPTSIREITMPPDNLKVYRTQAGPLATRAAAQTVCAQLASQGDECYVVETMMASVPTPTPMPTPAPSPSVVTEAPPAAPVLTKQEAVPSVEPMDEAALPSSLPPAKPSAAASSATTSPSLSLAPPVPTHTSIPVSPPAPQPVAVAATTPSPPPATTAPTMTHEAPIDPMDNALDEAVAQAPDAAKPPTIQIGDSPSDRVTSGVAPAPRQSSKEGGSLWSWLTGDEEVDDAKPAPAPAPVAAPVDAVATAATLAPAIDASPAPEPSGEGEKSPPVTDGEALAALPTPSPVLAPEAPPAPVAVTPQVSPLAAAPAPPAVKVIPAFPPPPPPLPASANAPQSMAGAETVIIPAEPSVSSMPSPVLATPAAPESTGTLIVVPMSPPVLGTPGGVQVGEAQRVPLSDAEKIPPPPAELPAPVVGVNEPTDFTRAPLVPPSSIVPQKTLWAQIQYFENQQTALAFWDAYRTSHPDFPAVRVRATSPLAAMQRGDDRVSLRVGPFAAQGFIRMLCDYVEATDDGWLDKNMECGSIVDLGASANAYAPRERTAQQALTAARYAADHPGAGAATSYWVQLGSYASYRAAQNAWNTVKTQNNEVLGDTGFQIRSPNQGSASKPVFRLQTGPFSSQMAAKEVCGRIRVNQGQCLVLAR